MTARVDIELRLDDVGDLNLPWALHHAPGRKPVTPFLSMLALGGRVFDRFYTGPACSTDRAMGLTCTLPLRNGVGNAIDTEEDFQLDPEMQTWVEVAADAGISVALFGKHHLAGLDAMDPPAQAIHPIAMGFDYYEGTPHNIQDYYSYKWWTAELNGDDPSWEQRTSYHTALVMDSAAWWIEDMQPSGDSLVVCLAPNAAHGPQHSVPDMMCSTPDDGTEESKFLRAVEAIDYCVAQVYGALTAEQRANCTWWIHADNGGEGEGKGTCAEGGVNGTLLVHGPGVVAGRDSSSLISVCDIGQTILVRAGLQPLAGVYGMPIHAGLLDGTNGTALSGVRQYVTSQKFLKNGDPNADKQQVCAVWRGGWKLRAKKNPSAAVVESWFEAPGNHVEVEVQEGDVPAAVRDALRVEAWRAE